MYAVLVNTMYDAPIYTSTTRLEAKLSNATRYVEFFCKFMNPPKHGSHGCLKRAKGYVFKWTPIPPLEILANLHLERPRKQKTESGKFQKSLRLVWNSSQCRSLEAWLVHAAMLFSKRCLWSCMVRLIQLPKSARMVYLTGQGPCACQGSKGFKGSLRGSWLKRSLS